MPMELYSGTLRLYATEEPDSELRGIPAGVGVGAPFGLWTHPLVIRGMYEMQGPMAKPLDRRNCSWNKAGDAVRDRTVVHSDMP